MTSPYKPAPGRFLISEPFMEDQNFRRTVVFLVEHNEGGSLGFVINRQLKLKVHEVVEQMPRFEAPVFMGGPVEQNTLHYLHRYGDLLPGSQEVCEGVYWGGDFDILQDLIAQARVTEDSVLFFVGYSGWGPKQLEGELEQKAWIVAPAKEELIFQAEYDDLWRQVLRSMGDPKYQVISNYPVDPSLN